MEKVKRKEWTREERQLLHKMLSSGKSFSEIGLFLDRDRRVVKRASVRYEPESPFTRRSLSNAYERGSHDHEEHKKRLRGPKKRSSRLRGNASLGGYVEAQLRAGVTPELIAGRIEHETGERSVCHETIYQWIYRERRDLMEFLPLVSHRGRRKRSSRYEQREPALPKRSISERPEEVEKKERFGDHERDTVKGPLGSKPCILTLRERKSRVVMLEKLSDGTSEATKSATVFRLLPFPKELRLTMTQDNGPENALHVEEEKILEMTQYFCHPYCAPERGSVENANRFAVRSAFPKGTDFGQVNFAQVRAAEISFNNRPMKCHGFRTPLEVFAEELKKKGLTPEQVGLKQVHPIPFRDFGKKEPAPLRA